MGGAVGVVILSLWPKDGENRVVLGYCF